MDTTTAATSGKLTLAFASESSTMVPFLLAGYCEWMVGNYGGIPDHYTRHVEAWDSPPGQTVREFTLDIDLANPGTYDDVCGEGGRYIVMTFIHHPESLPLFASAYDNIIEGVYGGVPGYYGEEIAECMGGEDLPTTEVFACVASGEITAAFKPKPLTVLWPMRRTNSSTRP